MTDQANRRKRKIGMIVGVALGVIVLVVLILYQSNFFVRGKIEPGKTVLPHRETSLGDTFTVRVRELPVIYKTVGTVRSRDEVEVSARIIARVQLIKVRIGDKVKKNDVLVQLDDSDLAASVAQARERVGAAAASLKGAADNVEKARAAMDYALIQRGRMRSLFADNAVAKKQLDEAESTARQTTAAWNQALQAQRSAASDRGAAEQAMKEAQARLAFATIRSPMDGIVSDRLADPGDLASPGKTLLAVFNPGTLRLEVPVRESLVRAVKLKATVPFDVPALNRRFVGEVREIVPAVDPGSRTFMVKICLGRDPKSELWPGMFGTLSLPLGVEKALVIPEEALHRTGQLEYVMSTAGGRLRRILVRTVPAPDDMRRVLSGLEPGMEILVPRQRPSKSTSS